MAGNTFGTLFRITTFGESHGPALGVVIDGCPPGISLSVADFLPELARRRPGQSTVTTARNEPDTPELLSGTFDGKTTGMPISIIVRNVDQRSEDYATMREAPRPGHAEMTYVAKYGIHDYRGSGRASGRETVARVLGGVVARKILPAATTIVGHTVQISTVIARTFHPSTIELNPVRCADPVAAEEMVVHLLRCKEAGNSAGGVISIQVDHPPIGLGEPVFDKLKADLAKGLLSIGAVIGCEFGAGFAATTMDGQTFVADPRHLGGIVGGISNGEPLQMRVAVKPTSTIGRHAKEGRHDPCVVPRVVPVTEAMVALVLADHYLRERSTHSSLIE